MDPESEPSPESGSSHDSQRAKKRRLAGACDACRKRKTKCDSSQMDGKRCTHCQTADIQCTHDTPRQPTKTELTMAYIQTLEEKVKKTDKMYSLLQRIYPGQDIGQILDALPENADELPSDLVAESKASGHDKKSPLNLGYAFPKPLSSDLGSALPPSTEATEDSSEADDFTHIELSEYFSQLGLGFGAANNRFFFGPASQFMFFKHCSDVKAEFTGRQSEGKRFRRPAFWFHRPWEIEYARALEPRYIFPEDRLLNSLVGFYFEKINSFMPLLHRPTFLKMLSAKQHLRDTSFGTTVLMVCALGARFSSDPQVLSPGDTSGLSAGWRYFRQVPLHPDGFLAVPTLHDLQYYSLVHIYLLSSSVPHVAWNILGLAMQSALAVGAHRRSSTSEKPSKDGELLKRAFWCLILVDRMSSAFVGRPCVIWDEDYDLDFPIECDDEYWETEDPEKCFKQPPGKPSVITSFVCILKLLQIQVFAHRTLYSTKKSKTLSGLIDDGWELRIVAQLDSSMNQWKDSLPDFLRWDPERADFVFFHQSVALHVAYSYVQIHIHRPFLMKKSPLSFSSLAICTNAARSCAHVLEVGMSRGIQLHTFMITATLTAGLVISLNLWGSTRSGLVRDPRKDMQDLQTCLNVLKESEKRWHVGGRAFDLLTEVSFLADDYQPTHNKRRRDSSQAPQHRSESGPRTSNPPSAVAGADYSYHNNTGVPPNMASVSDWDLLLIQLGFAQPSVCDTMIQQPCVATDYGTSSCAVPPAQPTTYLPDYTTTTIQLEPTAQDGQHLEYSMGDALFSLWSDIPSAFSIDEWDTYLADLGKSSYP